MVLMEFPGGPQEEHLSLAVTLPQAQLENKETIFIIALTFLIVVPVAPRQKCCTKLNHNLEVTKKKKKKFRSSG